MSGLTVCAPLRIEARAVRRGLRDAGETARPADTQLIRTGYGPVRAAAAAATLPGATPCFRTSRCGKT